MKHLLILSIVLILFLNGCVNQYTIKDFDSPAKFYTELNEKVKDRSVEVVADSNKTYEADSLTIRPDSLFFMTDRLQRLDELKSSYNISEIRKTSQRTDHNNRIVHVLYLNNGDIISAKSIFAKDDSLFLFDIIPGISNKKENVSLAASKVNLVSFNNRLKGMEDGAGFYALAGILFGIKNADQAPILTDDIAAIGGAIVFGIGGAVIGTIIGSDQEYIINEQNYNCHGFTSIKLLGGINVTRMGITINSNNSFAEHMIGYSAGVSFVWSLNNSMGIKSGIFYNSKGGSFDQYIASSSFTYHRDVFVDLLEFPLLFQYSFSQSYSKPRFYAGPQIGFFLNGRIDNIYDAKNYHPYPLQAYYRDINSKDVNNPVVSLVLGAGFNLQKYITMDFQYEYGLSKFSNSLFDGEVTNIKLNSFSILLGYGL